MRSLPKAPLLSEWLRRAEGQPSPSASDFLPKGSHTLYFLFILLLAPLTLACHLHSHWFFYSVSSMRARSRSLLFIGAPPLEDPLIHDQSCLHSHYSQGRHLLGALRACCVLSPGLGRAACPDPFAQASQASPLWAVTGYWFVSSQD